jgi:hypothetical protein
LQTLEEEPSKFQKMVVWLKVPAEASFISSPTEDESFPRLMEIELSLEKKHKTAYIGGSFLEIYASLREMKYHGIKKTEVYILENRY